jgi:hypothetical protein
MAVKPDIANQIISEFNDEVETIIISTGLEHHSRSSNLATIHALKDAFADTVMASFIIPSTTKEQLLAEARAAKDNIQRIARQQYQQELGNIAAMGSTVTKGSPSDSSTWNNIIGDTAHRIEKLSTMYADQINNMPKALRARIDDDFAKVLDDINAQYNRDPSPGNAHIVSVRASTYLESIERNLEEAAQALLTASLEYMVQTKLTELQQMNMALMSIEQGMTKTQIDAYRSMVKETKEMIQALGKPSKLIYDKTIRDQKVTNINQKLSALETLRVNASGVSQSLSGYYGSTSRRPARGIGSIGGVGTTLGHNTSSIGGEQKNFRNGVPPGFAGFAGKMTESDIANKHPPGTSKAHIKAMKKYMDAGMGFEDAHNKANADGFTPNLGGGGRPF